MIRIATRRLSQGTQGPDVAQVHRALTTLGRSVGAREREQRIYGPTTAEAIRALQEELGLPATGAVDENTVKVINGRLGARNREERVVRGSVRMATGALPDIGPLLVRVWHQDRGREHLLGDAPLDANGDFEVRYTLNADAQARTRTDLRVEIAAPAGAAVLETRPSGRSIVQHADLLEVINFVITQADRQPQSEYEQLDRDAREILQDLNRLERMGSDHLHLLAEEASYPPAHFAALATARRLATETQLPPQLFYAWLRKGLPGDIAALLSVSPSVSIGALEEALKDKLISERTEDGRSVLELAKELPTRGAAYASRPPRPGVPSLRDLARLVLTDPEADDLLGKYAAAGDDVAGFWTGIGSHPKAATFRQAVELGGLTNNHLPLVQAILARQLPQVADVASLPMAQWDALLTQTGIPSATPGATAAEQAAQYRQAVLSRVESAFFRPFFAARLAEAGGPPQVVDFVKTQTAFDPRTTYIERFLKVNPGIALSEADKNTLKAYQRVLKLTGSATDTIAVAAHAQSAGEIVAMGKQAFTERLAGLSQHRAAEIFQRAARTNAAALALWSEHATALNRTDLAALPRVDPQAILKVAVGDDREPGLIPDWESLFGAFDVCACGHCNSVYGPAAYFVDLLQFLKARGVFDGLTARRPDLVDIELSCENSNTVLPYVDLVNEVLEDQVARPQPFVEQALAVTLSDLQGPVANATLRNVFAPPLQPGTSIEIMEPGTSWRLLDEQFAYHVTTDGVTFKAVSRSRQTTGTSDERRAYPQYRNLAAYERLKEAYFPWTLPFDLHAAQAAVFLAHLGVSRRRLIEHFRSPADTTNSFSTLSTGLAAERLAMTLQEWQILTGELGATRGEFWGTQPTDHVQAILEGSGLSFAELDDVLSTWFVNPEGDLRIEPPIGCNPESLTVTGLNDAALSRIHRFVRLWRKLGWTIHEVDKYLRSQTPDGDAPQLTNEIVVRLAHATEVIATLKLPVVEALALWGPIDTREPSSLYVRLFLDEKFSKSVRESFRLRPDGQEVNDPTQTLSAHAATLQAVFRLGAASFAELSAVTDGRLTLANLGVLLRRARLMQALGLSPQELTTAIALSGLDPFSGPNAAEQFAATVREVRTSGFRWPELDYLLRHRFQPPAPFAPTDAVLAAWLSELRTGILQAGSDGTAARRDVVYNRLAVALDVPEALIIDVLSAGTSLDTILTIANVPAHDAIDRTNAAAQFDVIEKLWKIALVVNRLRLPGAHWQRLVGPSGWVDLRTLPVAVTNASPIPFATWFRLVQFTQLRRELQVEDGPLDAALTALHTVVAAGNDAARAEAKSRLVSILVQWFGWPESDLAGLIGKTDSLTDLGLLKVHLPDDYHGPGLLIRLSRAIGLLRLLGVRAETATAWCDDVVDRDAARAIRGAAMARHDEKAWLTVARPIQDALRNRQRAALTNYLIARPEAWHPPGPSARVGTGDLFAHYLIDVEMDACQLTSRIKQAMGSVQLYAQRCLLGLEGAAIDDEQWLQWKWMKNYRVWEANKKVWLYPENWIQPELRDNKTPFFKDLEAELLQGEITDAAAERAVVHYLEQLDQVGRLEICGTYEDDNTRLLHVFGRTFNMPHVYFYRRAQIVDATPRRFAAWTPWERVDLDIEGDHLLPVVRNRKLMVLWPIFSEKQESRPVTMPEPGGTLATANSYWDLQLAWSEYQHGQWTAKQVSKATPLRAYQGLDDVLFDRAVRPIDRATETGHILYRCHDPNNEGCPPIDPGEGGTEPPPPPTTGSTGTSPGGTPPARSLVDRRLFSFKAFAAGDSVVVRGYLSLAHAASAVSDTAAAFGEFHLSGCRDMVTVHWRSSIQTRTLPLAPRGMRFDNMWLEGSGKLALLDGNLPSHRDLAGSALAVHGNMPGPLFDGLPTIASMKANRIDIDVLRSTPTPFRILPPHQDVQFKGDRSFFFMDHARTFLVTSTGTSGQSVRPDLTRWTLGDLAGVWTADYFGSSPEPVSPVAPQPQPSFVLMRRGADGRRIATRVAPMDFSARFDPVRVLPRFWTTRRYYFSLFQHPLTCEFRTILDKDQLRGLLSLETQEQVRPFFETYAPIPERVQENNAPVDDVDFRFDAAYESYNWELFFHIPLLIADRLTVNQRFEEALRWYHFIFNPAGPSGGEAPQRYWRTLPFNQRLQHEEGTNSYDAQSVINIEKALATGLPSAWLAAVDQWRARPFNPHAIARLRTTAYQRTVVMKYIDNLIAWGDQLFRRETLESLNEATQLYVLASEILGERPEVISRARVRKLGTFASLSANSRLGPLSNAEQLVPEVEAGEAESHGDTPEPPSAASLYFCVPENEKLLGYWNLVADRLFKLRHCMDIEGRVRQLPLFEPPIDPALLVRAQAAGLSINDALNQVAGAPSSYRFSVVLQRANDLVAETRNLAAALLSALEKRDGEALALVRSRQETALLTATRDVRLKQVDEAEEQIAALTESRRMAEIKKQFYDSRELENVHESMAFELTASSMRLSARSAILHYLAGKLAAIGALKIGPPTTAGWEVGPDYAARSLQADAGAIEAQAGRKNLESHRAATRGEFQRRKDDWDLQGDVAETELKQIDRQLAAAEIRLAVAERELANHDLQVEQAREADRFMRDKFTNADLYSWTVGQTSAMYFQAYQLALDTARRAERCLHVELGEPDGATSIIRPGYWDSLKKGLLAGDQLALDLQRLQLAYLEKNPRSYEMTKHVSVATIDPLAFIALKETGRCDDVRLPESLFDLDAPGHYLRRLQSVSVTIPCVTGPYTGVHCKLRLLHNEIRWDRTAAGGPDSYPRTEPDDRRFIIDRRVVDATVTSTAQNDAGQFETSVRDDRYLPFEGAGAISTWSLELPTEFRSFDYGTISDVILHLRYTSREGGDELKQTASAATKALIAGGLLAGNPDQRHLERLVSVRHEFPTEWHRFITSPPAGPQSLSVDIGVSRFPYFVQDREITISRATVLATAKGNDPVTVGIVPGPTPSGTAFGDWEGQNSPGVWTLSTTSPPALIDDILIVFGFGAE